MSIFAIFLIYSLCLVSCSIKVIRQCWVAASTRYITLRSQFLKSITLHFTSRNFKVLQLQKGIELGPKMCVGLSALFQPMRCCAHFDTFNAQECLSVEGPSLACSQTFTIYQTFIIWPCNDLDYGIISTQFNAQNFLHACIFLSILWFYGIQHSCEKMYKIGKCLVQQESRRPSPHLLMESQTKLDLVVTLTLVWPWPWYDLDLITDLDLRQVKPS